MSYATVNFMQCSPKLTGRTAGENALREAESAVCRCVTDALVLWCGVNPIDAVYKFPIHLV